MKKERKWGLWDTRRKRWYTTAFAFITKKVALQYKASLTNRVRNNPMLNYVRKFVFPRRIQ